MHAGSFVRTFSPACSFATSRHDFRKLMYKKHTSSFFVVSNRNIVKYPVGSTGLCVPRYVDEKHLYSALLTVLLSGLVVERC